MLRRRERGTHIEPIDIENIGSSRKSERVKVEGLGETPVLHAKLWKERLSKIENLASDVLQGMIQWARSMRARKAAAAHKKEAQDFKEWVEEVEGEGRGEGAAGARAPGGRRGA